MNPGNSHPHDADQLATREGLIVHLVDHHGVTELTFDPTPVLVGRHDDMHAKGADQAKGVA